MSDLASLQSFISDLYEHVVVKQKASLSAELIDKLCVLRYGKNATPTGQAKASDHAVPPKP